MWKWKLKGFLLNGGAIFECQDQREGILTAAEQHLPEILAKQDASPWCLRLVKPMEVPQT